MGPMGPHIGPYMALFPLWYMGLGPPPGGKPGVIRRAHVRGRSTRTSRVSLFSLAAVWGDEELETDEEDQSLPQAAVEAFLKIAASGCKEELENRAQHRV